MKTIRVILMVVISMTAIDSAFAQQVYTNEDKVANDGYDVVNYFTANSAERGSKEYSTVYKEATYYFVSAEHLETFKSNPAKYLPQFDGYCPFAVAKMNKKVSVDPKTFRIDDGKLYLFYNDFYEGSPMNTMIPWLNNETEMEKMANENWKSLKSSN